VPERADNETKALEGARDLVKQMVTLEAALLTFGVGYVSKAGDSWRWLIDAVIVLLLISLVLGVLGLFQIVSQTHSANGNINDGFLRVVLVLSILTFVGAIVCISFYILLVSTPASATAPSKPTSTPTPSR